MLRPEIDGEVAQRWLAATNSDFSGLVGHALTFAASAFWATRALNLSHATTKRW
jgi:hypothetical protein